MAQFSPESWLNSNRNGGSRRSDRWLKIARNIHFWRDNGYSYQKPLFLSYYLSAGTQWEKIRPEYKIPKQKANHQIL